MFDLKTYVHLHEIEMAVLVEQKLERAHTRVADMPDHAHNFFKQRFALAFCNSGGRGLLDELLVLTLDRAVALAKAYGVSGFVGKNLQFDVSSGADALFHIDRAVAERCGRLRISGHKRGGQIGLIITSRMPRPPPPEHALSMTG
ncbi:hypothetical protein SDC9_164491 [bioreactor metagenome]|uniref:Uncharacterized protein n=1 Tax=bioreactor metagenome TaxID=1076179 RepID=A0A645FRT7_9ZZZZ